MKKTPIKDIGEFGLIRKIASRIELYHSGSKLGIGDDAAIIDASDQQTVISTDMLMEGVHFDLSYSPLKHLGYKAMAVNFSDIAAMNAVPKQAVVSLALSSRFTVEAVEVLYEGMRLACEQYRVDLVGGDTTSSQSGLGISVTAIGQAPAHKVVRRSGAKVGDVLCITGDVGAAYLGLQLLEREKQVLKDAPEAMPQLESYTYLLERQLKPEARTDIIYDLYEKGVQPGSLIDVSDGIASEVFHICEQSEVSAVVYEEKLPFHPRSAQVAGEVFQIPLATCALNGGEDYELLMTFSQEDFKKIEDHADITPIGYIREQGDPSVMVSRQNQVIPLQAQGWNHFAKGGG